jgi:hypothetical protein
LIGKLALDPGLLHALMNFVAAGGAVLLAGSFQRRRHLMRAECQLVAFGEKSEMMSEHSAFGIHENVATSIKSRSIPNWLATAFLSDKSGGRW